MPYASLLCLLLLAACGQVGRVVQPTTAADTTSLAVAPAETTTAHLDWPRFGADVGRSSVFAAGTGITAANVTRLQRQQVQIDGTVDASAIYLHAVQIRGATHDAFFVTTTYGRTIALDADSGTVLWEFTPPTYANDAGSYRITTATPVADPDRQFIYAAAPDGQIRKLAVADGRVVWSTPITLLPTREKIAASLNYFAGSVIATTGGYVGDAPPYQGHVAILDAGSGALTQVWNALCSDRRGLMDPSTCSESGAAIWGRAGAVVDSATGTIFVATGDAVWDGTRFWGDAVLGLNPTATALVANYTPSNTAQLDQTDADLGSTSPVLLGRGAIAQGGKDGQLRTLVLPQIAGAAPHKGAEASSTATPGSTRLLSAPAVLRAASGTVLFVANGSGTASYAVNGGSLRLRWSNGNAGTSPVLAGGLLYVYDQGGALRVYDPSSGVLITTLAAGRGHWNSPIAVDGRVVLPEGNANDHATSGVIDIWRLR